MYRGPTDIYFFLDELNGYLRVSLLKTKNAATEGPIVFGAWTALSAKIRNLAPPMIWPMSAS